MFTMHLAYLIILKYLYSQIQFLKLCSLYQMVYMGWTGIQQLWASIPLAEDLSSIASTHSGSSQLILAPRELAFSVPWRVLINKLYPHIVTHICTSSNITKIIKFLRHKIGTGMWEKVFSGLGIKRRRNCRQCIGGIKLYKNIAILVATSINTHVTMHPIKIYASPYIKTFILYLSWVVTCLLPYETTLGSISLVPSVPC